MATVFTKIQRKINQGLFDFSEHCLYELADENFLLAEAVKVVLSPSNCFEFTDDESHTRYAFEGYANDGRMMRVIIFLHQGRVQFKTAFKL
ncbi:hypothetical protein BH10ACI1_BH10ACI1_06860 [soil metagenome]